MNRLIFISAVCLQIGWISGVPHPEGVGAYAYQDSNGHRYGGTYGLKDYPNVGNQDHSGFQGYPVPFGPDFDDFFPEYFRNLENLLQEAFDSNKEYQRKALDTAKKAYDITSNQAGFMPNIDFSRLPQFGSYQFPNYGMPAFGGQYPGFGDQQGGLGGSNAAFGAQNSAMAVGVAAPGFTHQFAGLSPNNPSKPNVDITNRFAETGPSNGFMSVSTSSFSSSSNLNGKQQTHRKAETLVNNNGQVTHYKVED